MFVLVLKQHPENFTFLVLLEVLACEIYRFFKKEKFLTFLFLNVCQQTFHISHARFSQKLKRYFNVKSSIY